MGKHKRQVERKALEIAMQTPPQFLSSEILQKKTWEWDHFLEKVSHSSQSAWISRRPTIWLEVRSLLQPASFAK